MPHLKILNNNDIKTFDSPPIFNSAEQKRFFYLPKWARELLKSFRTQTNKTGFVLQLGYFKAANRFFLARKYHQKDIEFISRRLKLQIELVNFGKYTDATFVRHKKIILEKLGYQSFNEKTKILLTNESVSLSSKQIKPRLMFMSLVDFLREKKSEIPSYYTFAEIITNALRNFEKGLISSIEENLSIDEKQLLECLLEFGDEYKDGEKQDVKIKRYKITLLKKSHQSTKPSKIKENINDLQSLQALFQEIKPVVEHLGLSSETIQYYAEVVIKSQIFQISRRENRKYLLLIAFVVHQYYRLNDVLIEILMQSVQTTVNTSNTENKEKFYKERKNKHQAISELSNKVNNYLNTLNEIEVIVNKDEMSAYDKIDKVKLLLPRNPNPEYLALKKQLNQLGKESNKIAKNEDYYDILESKSIKLQNRASEIVKNLKFDKATSNKNLIEVIDYYKKKDGGITANASVEFINSEEQEKLFDGKGKLRISLYKVLLFNKIADGIKSGALNLKYSYKYRAFDDYLISKDTWESSRDELLEKAGLCSFEDFSKLETSLKTVVQTQFKITNENIRTGKNKHVISYGHYYLTLR